MVGGMCDIFRSEMKQRMDEESQAYCARDASCNTASQQCHELGNRILKHKGERGSLLQPHARFS